MIRTHVHEDVTAMNVAISIIAHPGEGVTPQILRYAPGGYTSWEDVPTDGQPVTPSLTLGQFEARSVLDVVMAHFHGTDDARALRRDYDAERARVDKLTDAVIGMAYVLAAPSGG